MSQNQQSGVSDHKVDSSAASGASDVHICDSNQANPLDAPIIEVGPSHEPWYMIHNIDARFGEKCADILKQLQGSGIPSGRTGIETDIIIKRTSGARVFNRDDASHGGLEELLDEVRAAGFDGPVKLDVIQRRAADLLVTHFDCPPEKRRADDDKIFLDFGDPKLHFLNPRWRAYYTNDSSRLDNLVLHSVDPERARDFTGHARVLQWEPIPEDEYRAQTIEIAKGYDLVIYKLPEAVRNRTGRFIPSDCMVSDLAALAVAGMQDRLVLFGGVEQLARAKETWERINSKLAMGLDPHIPGAH